MTISNGLNETKIKKSIIAEIAFFDLLYFTQRPQNSKCGIEWYYSGHGQVGMIQLSQHEQYFYSNMIEHIVTAINKHTIALYKQKNFSQNTFKYVDIWEREG